MYTFSIAAFVSILALASSASSLSVGRQAAPGSGQGAPAKAQVAQPNDQAIPATSSPPKCARALSSSQFHHSRLNSCCSTQNHIPFRKYWNISPWRLPNACLLTVLLATRQSESCTNFASEHSLNQPDFVALNPTINCQRP